MVYKGEKGQNTAMDVCTGLNAKLPLPKSQGELDKFRLVTSTKSEGLIQKNHDSTWIGIRDLTRGKVKENWKDVEGNPVGSAYVPF